MVSLRVIARRLMGRRGVFLLRSILSELSYRLGIYEDPDSTGKANGISALMCTFNEEDWIEPSILSVKDLVDEYVIVDSSNDNTPVIVERLRDEHGLNIKLIRVPPGDILQARTLSLKHSSYRWLLVFDADIVLNEAGVRLVKDIVETLDPRRHYLVYWKYVLLCGDVFHVCSMEPYHIEHWLFTYSNSLKYEYLDYGGGQILETLVAPLKLYKPILLDKVMGVHLTGVRSPEKLALKHIRIEHRKRLLEYMSKGMTAHEAAESIARELYDVNDLRELGYRLISEMVSRLPVYDEAKYGPLPRILLDYLGRK